LTEEPETPGAKTQKGPRARRALAELHLYYVLVATYFFSFGLQVVLFPSLVAFILHEPAPRVGLAQTALSAPMFALLLFGGIFADRVRAGPALAFLHGGFAILSLSLAWIVAQGALTFTHLITYAIAVGCFAAFLLPVRDAALNGVLMREAKRGRHVTIASAAATATAVQMGAQILGIMIARLAGAAPAPFLALQGGALAFAAILSLFLATPKTDARRRGLSTAVRDIGEGLAYAFRDPAMGPMLISAAIVGVFVIGVFQVLFPLLIRESYGGPPALQSQRLALLFASFWLASFVSAVALSRMKQIKRPGRAMLASHLLGAVLILLFVVAMPFAGLIAVVICWGLVAGVAISMSRTIVQSLTDRAYLGRVLAVYSMGFMGGAPIGSALIGMGAHFYGARTAALFPGLGLMTAVIILAATTSLWSLELPKARASGGAEPAR